MTNQLRILVTGGAGFIGSHLVEALLRQRHTVAIIDNFDDFYPPALKRTNRESVNRIGPVRWHEVDIRDQTSLNDVLWREQPEVIVHLAARAGVRPSIQQPVLYQEVNVGGTLNLLLGAQSLGVKKFIFGSSSSVYGAASHSPFVEDEVDLRPVSPYAATKLAGELFCYTYSHLFSLPVVCLRFFTVYGPRQRPDLAIRKFVELMESGEPIPIYGDGNSGRDYTYVDDIVRGILAAISYDCVYDTFNLGNSTPVKLLELVSMLEEITGKQAVLNFLPPQAGDVPHTCADLSKSDKLLGYQPRTSFREGLERFWTWYQETRRKATPAAAQ